MITVYSKPLCGYCDMAKDYLKKNNIQYEEIRVDTNPEAREFLISEGHRTMPQIYHNGKLLVAGGGMALVRMDPNQVKKLIGEVVDVGDFKL
jgi:glutaredoxin 3